MRPNPINWQQLLDDIAYLLGDDLPGSPAHAPVGTPALAKYLGHSRSTVVRWMTEGAQPRHSDGEELLRVWVRLTGKDVAFAPRERAVLSATSIR